MKKIYCIGSSFTMGGGFEFHSNRGEMIKKAYSNFDEYPKTQYNYSYSGQLNKILGKDYTVFNFGKSGFGNEYITRTAFQIINDSEFNKHTDCLILEFTEIGRKEYLYKEIDDYIISNYSFKRENDDRYYHFPEGNESEYSIDTHGIAKDYYVDSKEIQSKLDNFYDTVSVFNKNTLSYQSEVEYNYRIINTLLSYLEFNNIKYIILSKMQLKPKKYQYKNDFYESKVVKWNDTEEFHTYMVNNKLTINDETNGEYNDGHYGIKAAKITAKKLKEYLNSIFIII